MTATVSTRADGRVTVVTIERPERRNAVDLATARACLTPSSASTPTRPPT